MAEASGSGAGRDGGGMESETSLPHDTLGYYARLNVSPDCSEEEIKKKYRQLVKFYHPDKVEQLKKRLEESGEDGEGGKDEDLGGVEEAKRNADGRARSPRPSGSFWRPTMLR